MATIIQFPAVGERPLDKAIEITSARFEKLGLPPAQAEEALVELREAVAPLFRSISLPLEIPSELELTSTQVNGVMQVVEEFFEKVKVEHANDIAYAVNVIAGLSARSALDRR